MSQEPQSELLAHDLTKLEFRAYDIAEWASDVLRRYHTLTPQLQAADAALLSPLYAWVFVPLTLWPFSITDLMKHSALPSVKAPDGDAIHHCQVHRKRT